jgi:hypothetical protein
MTRQPFTSPGAFGPEALSAMGEAYEATLTSQPNAVPGSHRWTNYFSGKIW